MNALFSIIWGVCGIIFMISGRPFIEVAVCFLICGIFSAASEISVIRYAIKRKWFEMEEYDD